MSYYCPDNNHFLVRTYHRVWWKPWQKIITIRCWECDFERPDFTRER